MFVFLLGICLGSDNGRARTPPQGWRDWNQYQGAISQDIMASGLVSYSVPGLMNVACVAGAAGAAGAAGTAGAASFTRSPVPFLFSCVTEALQHNLVDSLTQVLPLRAPVLLAAGWHVQGARGQVPKGGRCCHLAR